MKGELDFYVNWQLKWAVELLKEGKEIGEHLNRFRTGKYREVETAEYLVVDFRGPLRHIFLLMDYYMPCWFR